MSWSQGDFYMRKIGRATLEKMMPDFPSRMWLSVDLDHTAIYEDKTSFGDVMSHGNVALVYGARVHWGTSQSNFCSVYPYEGGNKHAGSPNPDWLRCILGQVYQQAKAAFDTPINCLALADVIVRGMYELEVKDPAMRLPYPDYCQYHTPALMWMTQYCEWYESWKERGCPMMVRFPYEGKASRLHLYTVNGHQPDVSEYPLADKGE